MSRRTRCRRRKRCFWHRNKGALSQLVNNMQRRMARVLVVFVAVVAARALPGAQPPAATTPDYNAYYQIGPDSIAHDGVPKGALRGPFVLPSQAYPGTQHTYWIYVPAQYDP